MQQAKLQDLEPDIRTIQDDIRLQLKLNRAFENEITCQIQNLQHKRQVLNFLSSNLRKEYLSHERALHPITKVKSKRSPRKTAKPLTREQTLINLASLCGKETADLVAGLLDKKGKE